MIKITNKAHTAVSTRRPQIHKWHIKIQRSKILPSMLKYQEPWNLIEKYSMVVIMMFYCCVILIRRCEVSWINKASLVFFLSRSISTWWFLSHVCAERIIRSIRRQISQSSNSKITLFQTILLLFEHLVTSSFVNEF